MLVRTKLARDGPIMAVLVALVLGCAAQVVFMYTIGKNVAVNDTAFVANEMTAQTAFNYVYTAPNTLKEAHGDAIAVNIVAANNMEATINLATIVINETAVQWTTAAQNANQTTANYTLTSDNGECFGTCLVTATANLNTEAAKAPTTKGGECFGAELATTIACLAIANSA